MLIGALPGIHPRKSFFLQSFGCRPIIRCIKFEIRAFEQIGDGENVEKNGFVAGLAPTNILESRVVTALSQGSYTALLAELNNGIGVGLVEVYDRGN